MNRHVVRALFMDALYQVLDNKVFRIFVVLVLVLVLPTFVIGAREDSLVFFFGWKEVFYQDLFMTFGVAFPGLGEAHVQVIQFVQTVFVDYLIGTTGVVFAVAATAFFVPAMLERGSADTLFSKPIGRATLLVARYVAGLIFVGLLAALLVGGMHVGLLLNSGYSDPGFLWSALTLVYLFALLQSFSLLVGVFTRSTVAAIIATMMLQLVTMAVHNIWRGLESTRENIDELEATMNQDAEHTETVDAILKGLRLGIQVGHYVLPKTSDAPLIAHKLRERVSGTPPAVFDPETELIVLVAPPEAELVRDDLEGEGVLWTRGTGEDEVRFELERRHREPVETDGRPDYNLRRTDELTALIAGDVRDEIEARPGVPDLAETRTYRWRGSEDYERTDERIASSHTIYFAWRESGRERRAAVFSSPPWSYIVRLDAPAGWLDDPVAHRDWRSFTGSLNFEQEDDHPAAWFSRRFDWDAELKYNVFFSLGSSLAFVLVALGLASWRLARIDF